MYDFENTSWYNTSQKEVDNLFTEYRYFKLQKIKEKINEKNS